MNILRLTTVAVLVLGAFVVTATQVRAQMYQSQSQSASTESSFSSTCEGTGCAGGKIEMKSTTELWQNQAQSIGAPLPEYRQTKYRHPRTMKVWHKTHRRRR